MSNIIAVWNFNLISTTSGVVISVGDVVLAVLLVVVGYWVSRWTEKFLGKRLQHTRMRSDVINAFKRLVFYSIFVLVALTVLALFGIPITAFAFATGAIAIGIGFGAQNIINNFISGWILIAEQPIRENDFIEVDGYQGIVKRIGARSTLVHRLDGVHILVPNSKLLENTVVNWTLVDGMIRNTVRVGVAYGSDAQVVSEVLKNCAENCSGIMQEPRPEIVFEDFGDSALIFDIHFWSDMRHGRPLRLVRSDLRLMMLQALAEANIVVAFPQRDIHLHTEQPIKVQVK